MEACLVSRYEDVLRLGVAVLELPRAAAAGGTPPGSSTVRTAAGVRAGGIFATGDGGGGGIPFAWCPSSISPMNEPAPTDMRASLGSTKAGCRDRRV